MDVKKKEKKGEKGGDLIKNYDRSLQKARVNVSLYNLTANINALPAKGKNTNFPALRAVGCKSST